MTSLALNGESILLKSMRVTVTQAYQDKDLSGQTSGTNYAEQGMKAKELRVSGLIPFSTPSPLKRLFELGSARSKNGNLQVYRIAHPVARSVNFREGTFTGQMEATEQPEKMAWLMTFTLRERRSVDEKKQAKLSQTLSVKKQTPTGTQIVTDEEEKMSWFESKVLTAINHALE